MLRLTLKLQEFFSSWRFPAILLAALGSYALLILAVLLIPAPAPLAQFADDFKVWCFGWDPKSGAMERGYVFQAFSEPIVLGGVIAFIWRKQLREPKLRSFLPYALVGLTTVSLAAVFLIKRESKSEQPLAFPARSLRIAHVPPPIDLVDQHGEHVTLDRFHGKVVILTGVYTSCGYACPRLLASARKAVYALPEADRKELAVLGITLDPEHDGPKELAGMARAQKIDDSDTYHFLTGPSPDVNRVLDLLEIARTKNPETGVIDHASIFVLVDRRGKIAYRFALGGELEERWLNEALALLIHEPA